MLAFLFSKFFPLFNKLFITTIFLFLFLSTGTKNPSIYSIYVIYVITCISRLCGTGNKNICGIYSTMNTMFVL